MILGITLHACSSSLSYKLKTPIVFAVICLQYIEAFALNLTFLNRVNTYQCAYALSLHENLASLRIFRSSYLRLIAT